MTELYIAGMPVVLPSVNITMVTENPFFTKSGEYTFDITLSLLIPQNAKVYSHINRENTSDTLPKRTAYMVVDNEVVLNGTETILGWTNESVSIKLVSGNSELNFLIGSDKKLRGLNLGSAPKYVKPNPTTPIWEAIYNDLKKGYPERDWQLIPYATTEPVQYLTDTILVGNEYQLILTTFESPSLLAPCFVGSYSEQVPQPYFWFIVRKVLEVLGYTLTENSLANHPILKDMYIVNGLQTSEFAKMLPDWTVSEFLSKVEKQFDCVFVVDQFSRNVRLLYKYQFNASNKTTYIEPLDEYEVEVSEDNRESLFVQNIGYSLDGGEYYNRMRLAEYILSKDFRTVRTSSLTYLTFLIEDAANTNRFKTIYEVTGVGKFIAWDISEDETERVIPVKVDSFANLYNRDVNSSLDEEFEIIPAEMTYAYLSDFGHMLETTYWLQLPKAEPSDPLFLPGETKPESFDELFNIQNAITAGSDESAPTIPSKIRVAIYGGLKQMEVKTAGSVVKTPSFPSAYVEGLAEYFGEYGTEVNFCPRGQDPFRLANLQRDIYSKSAAINTTIIHKKTFVNKQQIDVMSRFVANNKSYICARIKRTITENGVHPLIEGEFYALD